MIILPIRKLNRLHNHDYSKSGAYFVTICTKEMKHYFGEVDNGQMLLNKCGEVALDELLSTSKHYDRLGIDEFIIMPNHVHIIFSIVGAPLGAPEENAGRASASPTIGTVVRQYKSAVSRKLSFSPWQRSYHDHIIRNKIAYQKIANYIRTNPQTWEYDCHYN